MKPLNPYFIEAMEDVLRSRGYEVTTLDKSTLFASRRNADGSLYDVTCLPIPTGDSGWTIDASFEARPMVNDLPPMRTTLETISPDTFIKHHDAIFDLLRAALQRAEDTIAEKDSHGKKE